MNLEEREQTLIQKTRFKVLLLLGAAVVVAVFFAAWMGAFSFGFAKELSLRYNFAGGIDRGSPVRLGGIRVGRVASLRFIKDSDANVELKLRIENDAFEQITRDSKFYINLAGLIGERYIEIVPGSLAKIDNQEVLRGVDPPRIDQLISQGYGFFEEFRDFFNENKTDLKEMIQLMNTLAVNVNSLLGGDKTAAGRQEISKITNELLSLVVRMNKGLAYVENEGVSSTWSQFSSLMKKADQIHVNDIRKLMLEDGVKVNFSSKTVEEKR